MGKTELTGGEERCCQVVMDIKPTSKPGHCIYRVPDQLRKINKEAYTPRLISIGPFHHNSIKLTRMENQKPKYLKEFCNRIGTNERSLEDFIQRKEDSIRSCYAESFTELDSHEFVKMIKLDAAFIVELFLRKHSEEDDSILRKPLQEKGIQQDLILFENQLPYFFLEELFHFVLSNNLDKYPSFLDLTCNFFSSYNTQNAMISNQADIKHFTDLVRLFLSINLLSLPKNSNRSTKLLYSATKLDETGVKLEAVQDQCLLDITFEKSKCCCFFEKRELKIPCFEVQSDTECIFRNIMALEQCYYPSQTYICNYIRLMGNLMNNAKDVGLLVQKGIIVNGLRSNTVMGNMIKKLSQEIVEDYFCFSDICERVNADYEGCWNRSRAWFYRATTILISVYFSDLWRGTGTMAATILLVLTFVQTYCSLLQIR